MTFQEPVVEFVRIDVNVATTATSSCEGTDADYTCDDVLIADMEICNCWPSGSDTVTQIPD